MAVRTQRDGGNERTIRIRLLLMKPGKGIRRFFRWSSILGLIGIPLYYTVEQRFLRMDDTDLFFHTFVAYLAFFTFIGLLYFFFKPRNLERAVKVFKDEYVAADLEERRAALAIIREDEKISSEMKEKFFSHFPELNVVPVTPSTSSIPTWTGVGTPGASVNEALRNAGVNVSNASPASAAGGGNEGLSPEWLERRERIAEFSRRRGIDVTGQGGQGVESGGRVPGTVTMRVSLGGTGSRPPEPPPISTGLPTAPGAPSGAPSTTTPPSSSGVPGPPRIPLEPDQPAASSPRQPFIPLEVDQPVEESPEEGKEDAAYRPPQLDIAPESPTDSSDDDK